jgi:leucine-zipper of insertion element IS481
MDTHKNAPLPPKGREMTARWVMDDRLSKAAAARQFHTTPKTVAKWVERFEAEGLEGLRDPFLEAALIAEPSDVVHLRGGRGFALAAETCRLHRRGARGFARRLCRVVDTFTRCFAAPVYHPSRVCVATLCHVAPREDGVRNERF